MKIYLFVLFVAVCGLVDAQKLEYDLYTFHDLRSISKETEELMIELSQNPKEINYFKHFYYSSDDAYKGEFNKAESDFSEFIVELKNDIQSIRKSNNTKIIQLVFDRVNNNYLRSLDINSGFSDIFKSGNYNYRTSAALYMSVLLELQIPFTLSEKFSHTEVIAFPEAEEIHLIGPDINQENGVRYIDIAVEFKNDYVRRLRENKLLNEDETRNKTNLEIFNESYYSNHVRGPKEYIGILHFWNCLGTVVEDNLIEELNSAIIGNLYCPGFRGNMLISSKLSQLLSKKKYETIEDIKNLELVARIPFTVSENDILATYDYFTEKVLFEKSNLKLFDTCSEYLMSTTINNKLKSHAELVYNSERGRFLLLQYNNKGAIPYLLKAHKKTPENIKLTNMLVDAIFENFKENEDTSGMMSNTLNDTFLLHDSRYLHLFCFYLSGQISDLYTKGDFKNGDNNLEWFEKLIRQDPMLIKANTEFNDVYLIPARFYQKTKNLKKSREYLQRGLLTFPKDYTMQSMLSSLK